MRFTNLELDWLVVAVGLDDSHVFLVLSCDLLILLIMVIKNYNLDTGLPSKRLSVTPGSILRRLFQLSQIVLF